MLERVKPEGTKYWTKYNTYLVQLPDLPDITNSSTDNKRFIQVLNYRKLPDKQVKYPVDIKLVPSCNNIF